MISKSEYHAVEAVEFEVVKHFVDSDSYSNTWVVFHLEQNPAKLKRKSYQVNLFKIISL